MNATEDQCAVVLCLIPRRLAGEVHDPLHRHFAGEADVEVVVERRRTDRRSGEDRRYWPLPAESIRNSTRSWSSFGGRSP